ncbi:MAG: 50S ribosomal protein L1 [Armatimonadetes bacterium]|nr:50S ribosomal protein L1 [Armatimonadota bacterium]
MARKTKRKNKTSQRFAEIDKQVDPLKYYTLNEAIDLVKKTATAKFKESVDMAVRLGIDAKKSEQNVRGITNLPHGTGKKTNVAVLANGEDIKIAEEAGADTVGDDDLIKKIQGGWKAFDVMVATAAMAPQIGKIGKFLGPKTPNKRNGTVTTDIAKTVKEIKAATRAEYRIDKAGVIHMGIGKTEYSADQIRENFNTVLDAINRARPSSTKGKFIVSITLSSTMGPGVKVDSVLAVKGAGG